MKERVIVIKRMEFITIAIVLGVMLLVGVPLLISGCAKPSHDTDDIDGGVQHSVDTGAPKTISSTLYENHIISLRIFYYRFDDGQLAYSRTISYPSR